MVKATSNSSTPGLKNYEDGKNRDDRRVTSYWLLVTSWFPRFEAFSLTGNREPVTLYFSLVPLYNSYSSSLQSMVLV